MKIEAYSPLKGKADYRLKNGKWQYSAKLLLTNPHVKQYASRAFAKSKAESANSRKQMANGTPRNRAFFVRSTNTPQENALGIILSMMACSGKGIALYCVPFVAVLQLTTRYRPIRLQTEAIAPKNLQMELSAMIYLFLAVDRYAEGYAEEIVRVEANNITNARLSLSAQWRLLFNYPIQQYPRHKETQHFPPLHTICNRRPVRQCRLTRAERAKIALFSHFNVLQKAEQNQPLLAYQQRKGASYA